MRAYGYIENGRANLTLRTMLGVAAMLRVQVAELLVPPQSSDAKRGRPRTRMGEAARERLAVEAGSKDEPEAKRGRAKKSRS